MDFRLSDEQQAVADLADKIFSDHLTASRWREIDDRFDPVLWRSVAEAGLLGLSLPEAHGGGGQDFLTTAILLEQVGRHTAPLPILASVVMGALAVAEFGSDAQRSTLLPGVIAGDVILTAALVPSSEAPPRVVDGRLSGAVTCVPAGALAHHVLVAAGDDVAIVDTRAPGVSVTKLVTTTGDADARIVFDGVAATPLVGDGVTRWITARATAGMCAVLAGVCKKAVELTASYAKTREQFDRPIATFQAVSQRAADAYVDAEAVQLTARQAAWRISEGLPAEDEVAIAKFFAADAGQRVVHAAQHIHGGVGVDRDYPLHRYFLLAKQLELSLGGATAQLLTLGARIAG